MIRALALILLMFGAAGCMGNGSDLGVEGASVKYEGQESGEHEDKAKCDEDGRVTGSGKVEDGTLTVTLTDGSGDEIWTKEYKGDIDFGSESVNGASGE